MDVNKKYMWCVEKKNSVNLLKYLEYDSLRLPGIDI